MRYEPQLALPLKLSYLGSRTSGSVLQKAGVVVIGTRAIDRKKLETHPHSEHIVLDLVDIEKSFRPAGKAHEGL